MTAQRSDSDTVTEVLPEKRQLRLQGLYLGEGLAHMSAQLHRCLVVTTYLTDQNGVIAKADGQYRFQVPPETRNASDWRLSQELMAQADVLISGGDYLSRASVPGGHKQDVLRQFEAGHEFENLGAWRLQSGYARRSPHVAVVTRHLDFQIPEDVIQSGRRVAIFTTESMANSAQAQAMTASGAVVLGSGEAGVDGNRMIDYLCDELGARVIVMTSGPGVLQLLLDANRLDLLYITEVQRKISFDDPSMVKMLLPGIQKIDELPGFPLTHEYRQDHVVTGDGSLVSQLFRRYDRR